MPNLIFDLETDHKKPAQVSVVWCIGTIDRDTGVETIYGPSKIHQALAALCAANRLYGHNIRRYDLPVLQRLYGAEPQGQVIDSLLLSRLYFNGLSDEPDEYGRHSLEAWGQRLGHAKGDYHDFTEYSADMAEYCLQDCRIVGQLVKHFAQYEWNNEAARLELEYDAFVSGIRQHGFRLDVDGAHSLRDRIQRRLDRFRRYLDTIFPPVSMESARPSFYTLRSKNGLELGQVPKFSTKKHLEIWRKQHGIKPKQIEIVEGPPSVKVKPFNPMSSHQVIPALRKLGWQPTRENKSGSVKAGEIDLYQSGIPAGRLIAGYRAFDKVRQFTCQWIKYEQAGRLYPNIVSLRAATGRSACLAPNIQQVPSAKKRASGMKFLMKYGHLCRSLFLPSEGYRLVGCDLSGIEVRLLAHRLHPFDDGQFASMLLEDSADVHQVNADAIGISRDRAKTVLYGSMYGTGPSSLAQSLGITYAEAKEIIEAFTTGIEGFRALKRSLISEFNKGGRIRLIDGRRLQVTSAHKLLNYSIQGDAAIVMKHWAMDTARRLENTSYRTLAVVHDEIQSECLPEEVDHVMETMEQTATDVGERLGFWIRIDAEAKAGSSWRETH